MTKTILFLRHSIKSAEGLGENIGISSEGVKLAQRIARIIQGEFGQRELGQRITDKIIHSGIPRARRTAEIIAESIRISEMSENTELMTPFMNELKKISVHPLFREGDITALKIIDDELKTDFVKREGLRLKKTIEKIATEKMKDGETLIVVGHGNNSCLALVMGFKIPILPVGDEIVDTISMKPLYGLKLRISDANIIIGGEFFTPY